MASDNGNDDASTISTHGVHSRTSGYLYISHALSTWNSRLFEFGAVLLLASIFPNTLSPMSIYALIRSASAVILAHPVGRWIDTGNRLTIVRVSILGQRLAVAGSCGGFWAMEKQLVERQLNGVFLLLVVLACVEKLCSMGNMIAVERDWVVTMTEGDEDWRRLINARIRRIDLICKLIGPLTISLIFMVSTIFAIWAVVAMNLASVLFEYFCIERVYKSVPSLDRANFSAEEESSDTTSPSTEESTSTSSLRSLISHILPIDSIKFYFRHPAFLPSFSLALLYLTVLSFSGQMITYLLSVGYTPLHVGVARTGSTIVELSATWVAPGLMKRIGPIRGGLWSLSWQMACLAIGVSWYIADVHSPKLGNQFMAATVLVVCVAFSRLGLWGYDLCAQIIVQDEVEASHRGSFSTVEAAFQNVFEMLSYGSTIVFSRPDQFRWPMTVENSAISTRCTNLQTSSRHHNHPPSPHLPTMQRFLPPRLFRPLRASYRLSSSSTFTPRAAPPKLPAAQQAEFERLQRDAAVSSAFQPSAAESPSVTTTEAQTNSTSAVEEEADVNPGLFRGAPPEFEGDVNPKTGEVGGPKNEPLRWGGNADWSYNGRVTDF